MSPSAMIDPLQGRPGIFIETRLRRQGFIMQGPHNHPYYELFYVQSGCCRSLVQDYMYDLQAGDFILIPPYLLHYTRYPSGECRRCTIFFHLDDLSEEMLSLIPEKERFYSRVQLIRVPGIHKPQIDSWIHLMTAERTLNDYRSPVMLKILLQGLFLLCGRVCSLLYEPPLPAPRIHPQIVQAFSYINDHFMEPVTTADVAAAVGLSPNYLTRKFRESAGIGIHDYLVHIRLDHAAYQLISTDDSISGIAVRCGFADANYFKDAFRKKYGVNPTTYRNQTE